MGTDSSFLRTPRYKEVIAWAFTLHADTTIRGLLLLVKEIHRRLPDWWRVQLILIVVRPSNALILKLLHGIMDPEFLSDDYVALALYISQGWRFLTSRLRATIINPFYLNLYSVSSLKSGECWFQFFINFQLSRCGFIASSTCVHTVRLK